ncbi:DNA-binding transcriptional regulator Cro [Pseudomonas asplenii]|uniref:DNA-binding transcriptional regulator Cro n=1 Tax=Pseudomonas asplenii TaxID=53407 RepID=A0A0N0E0Y9_9PSED|nr:Cro/CI family transcriptional regulator [Pseudomonas fuscovaginae]KPA87045.1 DNA-binding transcriptional regulator Cro [Pseudomonas fuscovaginae]
MKTREVADFFGSKTKLAQALGIRPSAVTMWGETIPESRQYQIQVLSKGKFKAARKSQAA